MKKYISPSLMCGELMNMSRSVRSLENAGADFFHIDIMDGHFVPNITLGTDFCREIKKITAVPLDIHLMIEKPENLLPALTFGNGDIVSVHYESTPHTVKALQMIKERGALGYIAINPGTPCEAVNDLLPYIDGVLIMTVNPGFAGQKMCAGSPDKIKRMKNILSNAILR